MLLSLELIRRYWREGAIGALVVLVFLVAAGWEHDRKELAEARLVYQNPKTSQAVQFIRVEGPTKTVTRWVEKDGDRVTKVETHEQNVTATTSAKESAPVPLSIALAPPRTNRWLFGGQVDPARAHELKGYMGLVGYSWANRVDVSALAGGDGCRVQVDLRR